MNASRQPSRPKQMANVSTKQRALRLPMTCGAAGTEDPMPSERWVRNVDSDEQNGRPVRGGGRNR
jgi:hypothetical protein